MTLHELTGPDLSLTVDPERGGKIVSLRDAGGSEWLTAAPPGHFPSDAAFGAAEMAGWDECAPTITSCSVDGRPLPDHGDLWNTPFTGAADDLRAEGSSWPYRLRRRVHPVPGGWRLEYEARATGTRSIPFLWAAHPQFKAPVGTRLELESAPIVVDVLHPERPEFPWTASDGSLSAVPDGGCRKLYVHPSQQIHSARLLRPDAPPLHLRWSASLPYLGLWFDNAAWAREPVIAVEPALAYADSLADAVAGGTASQLHPAHDLEWWFEISLTP
jgi:hypothetical protein